MDRIRHLEGEADMKQSRFTEERIIAVLREQEAGSKTGDVCRKHVRAWPKANSLTPADGDEVRLAFQTRLGRLHTISDEDLSPVERDRPTATQEIRSRIGKSVLATVARRLRDKAPCGSTPKRRVKAKLRD